MTAHRDSVVPAMSESDAHIVWAAQASRVGTWVNDLRTRRVAWSDELCHIFGIEPAQFAGTEAAFFEFILPEDQPRVAEVVQKSKEELSEYEVEFRFRKGGEIRWMLARGQTYADEKGVICRLAGIGMDITERKRAELRLEAVYELTSALVSSDSLEDIYEHAMRALLRALNADRASILLFDPDGVMRFKATSGLSEGYKQAVEGHSPWTADVIDPEPIMVPSVADADLGELLETIQGEGIRALGFFPLLAKGRLIGKFMLYFDREHEMSKAEMELAQAISGHIAVAVERSRAQAELKQSQKAAAENLEEMRAIMEALPVGIYIAHDPEAKVITGNRGSQELLEMSSLEDNMSLSNSEAGPTHFKVMKNGRELAPEELPVQVAAREGKEIRDLELEIAFADGRVKTELVSALPLFDAEGKTRGSIATAVDITALRRSEASLRASEEQLRIVTDSMAAAVARCSKDYRYLWISKAYSDWVGADLEEVAGKPIEEVLGPSAFKMLKPFFDRALSGESFVYEVNVPYKALGHKWIEARYSPTFNESGEVDGWVAIIFDIEQRKRTEDTIRALLRIGERLSSTLDIDMLLDYLVDEAIQLVKAESGVAGLFTGGEMVCRKYLKKGKALPLDYAWAPGEGLPGWLIQHKRPYITNDAKSDPQIVHALCAEFGVWSALSVPILNAENNILGFFEIHNKEDGSEFTEADQELLQAVSHAAAIAIQNALAYLHIQDVDKKKDEFLATLAHELRNPLAPIRNAIQILQIKGSPDPEVASLRNIIERQVTQMTRLVDDLLDVSRITRGRIQLKIERVDLQEVIENAIETVRPLLESSQHELSLEFPKVPINVEADPVRVAQIVSNLLNNAAKYTEAGGRIAVKLAREDDSAVISVIDNGIGIPEDQLPLVFDMFSQQTQALERAQGGLGIGLSLVRGLVALHGGTIEAMSEGIGKGSEFRVKLPAMAPAHLEVSDRWRKPQNGLAQRRRRVLVVDDNQDHAKSLSQLLELSGHETHLAHDGEAAIQKADDVRPEVILLDIGMPKVNGYEAARRIREEPWGKEITLVALTGWGQEDDRRRAQSAGFDHHLTKPVDSDTLMTLLSRPESRAGAKHE